MKCLVAGEIPLPKFLWLLLPLSMRPVGMKLHRKPVSKPNKTVSLFGKPFVVLNGEIGDLTEQVRQIIGCNQYHIELIKDNDIVVDAGANMGVFSVYAAVAHPHATVLAFEPAQLVFDVLKENTKYYPNIRVFGCGLGEEEKQASLALTRENGANFIGDGGVPIEIKTIDGLGRVDFIKIDTEGYEANILKGARETIKEWKPVIAMSAYHKPKDKKELPELLSSFIPYECKLHHDAEEDLICKPKISHITSEKFNKK